MLKPLTQPTKLQWVQTTVTHTVTHQKHASRVERTRLQAVKRNAGSNDYYKRLNSGKLKQNRMERIDQLNASRAIQFNQMTEEN